MDKVKLKRTLMGLGKDLLTAFVIVAIVMLVLFAYCRIWPPMVVVESGSMQRYGDKSVVGVIDTGDMVFVKKVGDAQDLVTYVDGEASGYSKYGAYGDVIIYRPNGLAERLDGSRVIPIIHRLVLWVEINSTRVDPGHGGIDYANYSFDVPSLGLRDTAGEVVLSDYGFWRDTVRIYLGEILSDFEARGKTPHGGFITKGDHNDGPDQPSYEPVLPEWIVGKAWGELPWFGLIKLRATGANLSGVPGNSWVNLGVTLAIVITVPLALDFILPRLGKAKKASQQQADDRAGEEKAAPDAPPPQPDPETPQGDAPGSSLENAPK